MEWHPPQSEMVPAFGVLLHPNIVGKVGALLAGHSGYRVTSGYRTVAHNASVGGVPRSRHLWGAAIDVVADARLIDHLRHMAPRHGAVETLWESDHLHIGWPRPAGP